MLLEVLLFPHCYCCDKLLYEKLVCYYCIISRAVKHLCNDGLAWSVVLYTSLPCCAQMRENFVHQNEGGNFLLASFSLFSVAFSSRHPIACEMAHLLEIDFSGVLCCMWIHCIRDTLGRHMNMGNPSSDHCSSWLSLVSLVQVPYSLCSLLWAVRSCCETTLSLLEGWDTKRKSCYLSTSISKPLFPMTFLTQPCSLHTLLL